MSWRARHFNGGLLWQLINQVWVPAIDFRDNSSTKWKISFQDVLDHLIYVEAKTNMGNDLSSFCGLILWSSSTRTESLGCLGLKSFSSCFTWVVGSPRGSSFFIIKREMCDYVFLNHFLRCYCYSKTEEWDIMCNVM